MAEKKITQNQQAILVGVDIVDKKTGMSAVSGNKKYWAPKPGQITTWDIRTKFRLSNDFSIKIDWPIIEEDG